MTQRDPAKQLAKELADLRKEVRSGSRGSQMRFRALEGGGIPIFSEDGTPRGTIGILPDGTTGYETINDPTPPMPSAPILEPANAGLKIIWDGTFWADAPRPGDLRCVEVHASPYSVYTPDASTLRAVFITAGEIFLNLPPDPYTVVFVSRTTGNSRSAPSVSATETPLPEVTLRDLEEVEASVQTAADKALAAETRATEAEAAAATARQDALAAGASAAEADAAAAQAAADALQAKADAAAARQAATDAATSAGHAVTLVQEAASGKNTIFYSLEVAPDTGNEDRVAGDTWFRRDANGRIIGQWEWVVTNGTGAWVSRTLTSEVIASLDVGKLTTGSIAAGQRIIAGPEDATHAEMSDTGFRVFVEDPADGIPNEVVRLGVPRDGDNGGDVLGVADADGRLVASVSENGVGSFTGLNIDGDPVIQGVPLSMSMSEALAGRLLGYFRGKLSADITPIDGEIGVVEVNASMVAGRSYFIKAHFGWDQRIPNTEVQFRFRSTRTATEGGDEAPAPTVTSTSEETWWRTHRAERRRYTEDLELLYNCTRTGRHRFLLTAAVMPTPAGFGGVSCHGQVSINPVANQPTSVWVNFPWRFDLPPRVFASANSGVVGTAVTGVAGSGMTELGTNITLTRTNTNATTVFWQAHGEANADSPIAIDNALLTTMSVVDAGPTPPASGQQSAGGGAIGTNPTPPGGTAPSTPTQPPSPSTTKQQRTWEGGPVGKVSWRGNNTVRTDLGGLDVVQGRDPSGYNGVGKGAWWFDLPNITGTVDRVDLFLYSAHWYYNSGGMAVLNINDQRGADPNMFKMRGDWLVGGYPKPGGKWVTVPADWLAFFKGTNNDLFNGRATTITVGPTNDDLVHYGRFTDCRLRIWYTQ